MAAEDAPSLIKRVNRSGDDYYALLGVSKSSSEDEIKKAYKRMALRLHPDKCQESGAEEAFKKVNEAVSVLSDAEKRQSYDRYGVEGIRQGGGGGGGPSPEDIFAAFFGGGFPGGGPMGPGGGHTFVRGGSTGGGSSFQTFTFASGGPGAGGGNVFHFAMPGQGGQGGGPFGGMQGGGRQRVSQQHQRQRQQEAEEEEQQRSAHTQYPQLSGALEGIVAALGPLLPFAIVLLVGVFLMLAGVILRFVMSRAMFLIPIMYCTEGRMRFMLLGAVVLAAALGYA